jgi:diguanylate cyclase (GGDEF)-like protein/PAS domain S-box-containing protein
MLDLDLPDAGGLDGLRRIRSAAPRAAVIVRTGPGQEQRGLDALAAGAHEALARDELRPEVLQRSIEVALARQRADLAGQELVAIIETGEDALIGLTGKGRITSWDEAAERIYGYSAAEAVDRDLNWLAGSAGAGGELRRRVVKVTKANGTEVLEALHRRSDGTPIDVVVRLSAPAGPAQQTAEVVAVVRDISAQKHAERERARVLARLRETQRIARLGFWTLDARTGQASFSPEMQRMFAITGGAPNREAWLGFVTPAERARVDSLLSGGTGGREFAFDCHVASGPDDERTVHVIGRGDPDDPDVLLGTAQDVTELRAVERALRASRAELVEQRELLAAVVDNAPTGIALVPVSADRFLRVNQALCRILGYTEAELVAERFSDVTHPDDRQRGREAGRRLLEGEIPSYQTEIRYIHRDGHVIWAEISASLIRDDGGEPLYFVVLLSDITERKRVEQALQQERDHTAAILAAIGEGYALSVAGRISEINDALCTLTGYAKEDLLGVDPPWPFWPEGASIWAPDGPGAPPEDPVVTQMSRKDGSRFDAEVNARAAHNPDGSVLGWVIAIRDVSERQRYEAELERLATHDALTGLANHRLFHQRLAEEVAKAGRHSRPLSVAILDLDHFKQINDAHGHLVGDGALAAVAERLRAVAREGELLARVGGEEFAWILPDADEEGAFIAAERARQAVNGQPFPPVGAITLSAGVACRDESEDGSSLYEQADRALLAAKRAGRDQTVRWSDARVVG